MVSPRGGVKHLGCRSSDPMKRALGVLYMCLRRGLSFYLFVVLSIEGRCRVGACDSSE